MEAVDEDEEWTCSHCGSTDPHDAILMPRDEDWDPEVEIDITCQSVYITPVGGGHGFAFDHDEFEAIIQHFRSATEDYTEEL